MCGCSLCEMAISPRNGIRTQFSKSSAFNVHDKDSLVMSCGSSLTHRCFCDVEYMSRLFASLMLLFKLIEDTQLRFKKLLKLERIVRTGLTLKGSTLALALGLRTEAQDTIVARWGLQEGNKILRAVKPVTKLRTSGSP